MQYTLLIKPQSEDIKKLYEFDTVHHQGDSGFDLYVTDDVVFSAWKTKFVDLKVQCEMLNQNGNNVSYYLYPRSSISKTPLVLANSVGIIDAGYRGNVIAALRYIPEDEEYNGQYVLKKGTRLMQICSPTLDPLQYQFVDTLSETSRNSGGFGSTGK